MDDSVYASESAELSRMTPNFLIDCLDVVHWPGDTGEGRDFEGEMMTSILISRF